MKTFSMKAVDVIDDYEIKRNDISIPNMILKFNGQSAYLKPGNFGGDLDNYKNFMDSSFAVINQAKTENLIINLSNNLGGGNDFSDYLISFITDKLFHWNAEFYLKTSQILKEHVRATYDSTESFWKSVLVHKDGEIHTYRNEAHQPQAEEKRFKRKVYVLVNRQSHSQAAVSAAQIQDYDFASIVGEETAEFPSLYAHNINITYLKQG